MALESHIYEGKGTCPRSLSVFDVEQDGRVLPYMVTLEKFVEWVQRL